MKNLLSFVFEVLKIVVIALVIVVPVRYFLFQPFIVKGQSMDPNFSDGDYLIVDEISYRFRAPQRGEVVVFDAPNDPSSRYIKRIIGLPGETIKIEDGKVFLYQDGKYQDLKEDKYLSSEVKTFGDVQTTLNSEEYFVLGDNRFVSADSRKFGILIRDKIIGRVYLRAWPITSFSKIESPSYSY
jgi:signal peptidase I